MAGRLKKRPEILDRRREVVEHPFGSIKQWMHQGAFLMRGLRLHAAGLLAEHGFAVVEATNAAGALNVLQSGRDVRLLFTDFQMPGALDGMDSVREVACALAPRPVSDRVRPHGTAAGRDPGRWAVS